LRKWQYGQSIFAGLLGLALGIWLLSSDRFIAEGIFLIAIGLIAVSVGARLLGRDRR
jgi:hypothetical protein